MLFGKLTLVAALLSAVIAIGVYAGMHMFFSYENAKSAALVKADHDEAHRQFEQYFGRK